MRGKSRKEKPLPKNVHLYGANRSRRGWRSLVPSTQGDGYGFNWSG
jgi:hypothetical protein